MNLKSILSADVELSAKCRLPQSDSFLWRLAVIGAHSGDSWFWLAGLGILWLATRGEWHNRSAMMCFGIIFLAVLVLAIKFTIRRQRPPGEWGAVYRTTDPHSFPSGHAARAFMLVVLAAGLGPVWLALCLAVWAPLVSLARVSTGVHYLSDVIAGMILGLLAGWLVLSIQPSVVNIFSIFFEF